MYVPKLKQMLQCSTLLEFSGNCDRLLKNRALWYKLTIIIWNKPFHNAANVKCSQFEKIWIRLLQVFKINVCLIKTMNFCETDVRQNRAKFNFQKAIHYKNWSSEFKVIFFVCVYTVLYLFLIFYLETIGVIVKSSSDG